VTELRRSYGETIVLLVVVAAAGALTSLQLQARLPTLPLWCRSVATFGAAKLAADAAVGLFQRRGDVVFFEDFLRELAFFLLLGVLAAGVTMACIRYLGGGVDPAYPAVGASWVYALLRDAPRRAVDL